MKEEQFYYYFGLSSWAFEECCDQLRNGIEKCLQRRGLSGIDNIEYRDIIIGNQTASPLLSSYMTFIYTELDSSLSSIEGNLSKVAIDESISPIKVLNKIEKSMKTLIEFRNKLIHGNWTPQLIDTERPYARSFNNKITRKGIELKEHQVSSRDFDSFILECHRVEFMISYFNCCLDSGTMRLDSVFELDDDQVKIISDTDGEFLSLDSIHNEALKKLA